MGIFDDVGSAQETSKSGYFVPGVYLVKLVQVKHNNGFKGESIIIEGEVIAVNSEEENAPIVGETRAHVISGFSDTKRKDMALGDLKAFTRAAYNNPDVADWTPQIWSQASQAIVGEKLAGVVMKLECFMNGKGSFTIHRWYGHAHADDFARFGVAVPA